MTIAEILCRYLFFGFDIAIVLYAFSAFKKPENKIYQAKRYQRYIYKIGMLIALSYSFNIVALEKFRFFDLNMFLCGTILMLGSAALWGDGTVKVKDKK